MFMVEEKDTGDLMSVYDVSRRGDFTEFFIYDGKSWRWMDSGKFIPVRSW